MARRKQNPLNDIGDTVGGWLGGAAKSVNTFLTADQNPTINPTTRRAITATQQVADVLSGGAVTAAKAGPDAAQRFANQQIAIAAASAGVGAALPSVVRGASLVARGAKNPVIRQQVARRATDAAWKAKYVAQGMRPVSYNTVRKIKKEEAKNIRTLIEVAGKLQDENALLSSQLRAGIQNRRVSPKAVEMANEFMGQYQTYNPVYERAEQNALEKMAELYKQSGAAEGMVMPDARNPRNISKQLNQAANDLFRESVERTEDSTMPYIDLISDVRQAKAYQRARGIMARTAIENKRSGRYVVDRVAEQQKLMKRLEIQILRSQAKRSGPR